MVWSTWRKLGAEKWPMKGVMTVYDINVRTVVKTKHGNSEEFKVRGLVPASITIYSCYGSTNVM